MRERTCSHQQVRVRCEVWTRLPACETLARRSSPGRSRQFDRRLGDDGSVVLFCVADLRIRVHAPRCAGPQPLRFCVNARPANGIKAMLPIVQRSARARAAASPQNAIATKAKRR